MAVFSVLAPFNEETGGTHDVVASKNFANVDVAMMAEKKKIN